MAVTPSATSLLATTDHPVGTTATLEAFEKSGAQLCQGAFEAVERFVSKGSPATYPPSHSLASVNVDGIVKRPTLQLPENAISTNKCDPSGQVVPLLADPRVASQHPPRGSADSSGALASLDDSRPPHEDARRIFVEGVEVVARERAAFLALRPDTSTHSVTANSLPDYYDKVDSILNKANPTAGEEDLARLQYTKIETAVRLDKEDRLERITKSSRNYEALDGSCRVDYFLPLTMEGINSAQKGQSLAAADIATIEQVRKANAEVVGAFEKQVELEMAHIQSEAAKSTNKIVENTERIRVLLVEIAIEQMNGAILKEKEKEKENTLAALTELAMRDCQALQAANSNASRHLEAYKSDEVLLQLTKQFILDGSTLYSDLKMTAIAEHARAACEVHCQRVEGARVLQAQCDSERARAHERIRREEGVAKAFDDIVQSYANDSQRAAESLSATKSRDGALNRLTDLREVVIPAIDARHAHAKRVEEESCAAIRELELALAPKLAIVFPVIPESRTK